MAIKLQDAVSGSDVFIFYPSPKIRFRGNRILADLGALYEITGEKEDMRESSESIFLDGDFVVTAVDYAGASNAQDPKNWMDAFITVLRGRTTGSGVQFRVVADNMFTDGTGGTNDVRFKAFLKDYDFSHREGKPGHLKIIYSIELEVGNVT